MQVCFINHGNNLMKEGLKTKNFLMKTFMLFSKVIKINRTELESSSYIFHCQILIEILIPERKFISKVCNIKVGFKFLKCNLLTYPA